MLVTGGTRGIGAAVVQRFQLAGARVAATARRCRAIPWTASCSFARGAKKPSPGSGTAFMSIIHRCKRIALLNP
ncbi:MAG: hypothetical protein OSA97_09200, partial [Nevskia sp.]|nr:hypothetical protein [Nevskia sp.]